jgi:hypothetical protein
MKLLARLERTFGDWAIHNVAMYIVGFQAFTYLVGMGRPDFLLLLRLDHDDLFAGQWWRVFTMILTPPPMNPLFAVIAFMFIYFCGNVLESHWGAFRLNLYLLIGYLTTLLAALVPGAIVTNWPLMESMFLAFAWLYPDVEIRLYFIFPVKAKWLALLTWILYLFQFVSGNWGQRAAVFAGVANFGLFFGAEVFAWIRRGAKTQQRRMKMAPRGQDPFEPMHVCTTCGINEKLNPKTEFRYCPQCTGTPCYCIDHIHNHVHR